MNNKISYDGHIIKIMSLFETVTRSRLKDCFVDKNNLLTFVVMHGEIGRAVGKKASNVKKVERLLKRKIKIVEFNSDVVEFIKNLVFPLRIKNISEDKDIMTLEGEDMKTRGLLIGRSAKNLRNLEEITRKYYPNLKEIKVI